MAEVPPPASIGATGNLRSVELSWVYPSQDQIPRRRYTVYRGPSADALAELADLPAPPDVEDGPFFDDRFTDFDVEVGTTYYYAMSVSNGEGEGPLGDAVTAVPVSTGTLAVSSERSGTGEHDVVALASDGTETRLTKAHGDNLARAASPDGAVVAYGSNHGNAAGDYDLWVHTLGDEPRRLTEDAGSSDSEPAFSADGRRLAFTRTAAGGASQVWTVDVGGGVPSPVPNSSGDSQPSWSPTGRMLAVTHGGNAIVQTNLPGTFRRTLRSGGGNTYHHPSWSPTGQRMSYIVTRGSTSYLLTPSPTAETRAAR